MRTRLSLDSDVAQQLVDLAHRRKTSFKHVVNEMLRAGLAAARMPRPRAARFVVRASHCGFRPGIDAVNLNPLVDELEIEDFQRDCTETL